MPKGKVVPYDQNAGRPERGVRFERVAGPEKCSICGAGVDGGVRVTAPPSRSWFIVCFGCVRGLARQGGDA